MKNDKVVATGSNESKAAELGVEMLSAGGVGILALFPHMAGAAAALGFVAPLVRTAAGRAWAFQAARRGERVDEVAEGVRKALTDAEIAGKENELKDLLEQAVPIIEAADKRAQREMIERLIINAVRDDEGESAWYRAASAIRLVGEMSDLAAMFFGWVTSEVQPIGLDPMVRIAAEGDYHGLPRDILWRQVEELDKLLLIKFSQEGGEFWIFLRLRGEWLRDQFLSGALNRDREVPNDE